MKPEEINKFIGIPYKAGHHSYNGADCIGLVYLFYRDFLENRFDLPGSDIRPGNDFIHEFQSGIDFGAACGFEYVPVDDPNQFRLPRYAVVHFKFPAVRDRVEQNHIGLYLGVSDLVLVATPNHKSRTLRLRNSTWRSKIRGFYQKRR